MTWFLSALTVLLVDQAAKTVVLRASPNRAGGVPSRWRPRIRATENQRALGRWLRDRGRLGRWALLLVWAVAAGGSVALLLSYAPFEHTATRLALGAALGGATSNLADVLRRGVVVDFIDLRIWPVFNPADVAIVGGVGLALWTLW